MYGVIYKITNKINGKSYVGKTTTPLKQRLASHKCADTVIGKAIRKYGWKNFSVEVLEECDTKEQLNERDFFWIAALNCKTPNGYNRSDGGDEPTGYVCSDETRAKLSAAHKGKSLTEATRRKLLSIASRAKTSYKNLIAEMENLANHLGITKEAVSAKMRGKQNFTKEQVAKLVEIFDKPIEYLIERDDD